MADALAERAQPRHRLVGARGSRQLEVSPIALALAWNLARPGIVSPIIGPKSERQLNDNLAALDVELPNETVERIDEASEPYLPYPHDFMRMARQMTAMMVQQNSSAKS